MRQLAAVLLLVCMACSAAWAQDTSALINQQLDKPFSITLKEQTLPDALKQISEQTGVPIDVDPLVWELLPWGQTTVINANIENNTLRDALTAITSKLALTYRLDDEKLSIEPMPPLRRLARRSTLDEINDLSFLDRTLADLPGGQMSLKDLVAAIDRKLDDLKSPYAIEDRSAGGDGGVPANVLISIPRHASLMDALQEIPKQTNTTWYPWGKDIVILPKKDEVRRLLERKISVDYNRADVAQVLPELLQRSGVGLSVEPGAFARIPPEARRISLQLDNCSVSQALEAIAGISGVSFDIQKDGVYVSNSTPAVAHAHAVAILTLPDSGMQILVNDSQLTPELRAYLQMKTQRELDKIQQMMKDEGFKPAPAALPATEPTTDPDL